MKIKNLILSGVAALSVFTSCNDSFLEREPVGTLGESNAFLTPAAPIQIISEYLLHWSG